MKSATFVALAFVSCGIAPAVDEAMDTFDDVVRAGRRGTETIEKLSELQESSEAARRFEAPPEGLSPVVATTSVSMGAGVLGSLDEQTQEIMLGAGEMLHLALSDLSLDSGRFRVPGTAVVKGRWREAASGSEGKVADAGVVTASIETIPPAMGLTAHLNYLVLRDDGGQEVNLMKGDTSYEAGTDGTVLECSVRIESADPNGLAIAADAGIARIQLSANELAAVVDEVRLTDRSGEQAERPDQSHLQNLLVVTTRKALGNLLGKLDPILVERQNQLESATEAK